MQSFPSPLDLRAMGTLVLAEWELAQTGAYKQGATEFLESHWQKDALASLAQYVRS